MSGIKISSKNVDPISGLGRLGQRAGSMIVGSPKQRLKSIAVSNVLWPHFLMSTGAITIPEYSDSRVGYIADYDHVLGGIIVEVVDNKRYHCRFVQADSSGAFIDLGKKYTGINCTNVSPEAIILGDLHPYWLDMEAWGASIEMIKELKPKTIVVHDIFDAASCDPHIKNNIITRVQWHEQGLDSLAKELYNSGRILNELAQYGKVVVVASNHHEFLDWYIEECRHMNDVQNHRLALQLELAMLDGHDPVRFGVEKMIKLSKNIRWLARDEDFKIAKIQCGAHGDLGASGTKKCTAMTMENAYGDSFAGHTHSPEVLRGAWTAGTNSWKRMHYSNGPNSCMHSNGWIYSNSSRQLVNIIQGKWKG